MSPQKHHRILFTISRFHALDTCDPNVGEPVDHYRGGLSATTMLERARELRLNSTSAERIMWELLRDRRFLGVKFRRQHQFGSYILDFYSAEKCVAIELDGVGHCTPEQKEHDWIRDSYLCDRGVTVFRISNREFLDNTEQALDRIAVALSPAPELLPIPFRGRGKGDDPGIPVLLSSLLWLPSPLALARLGEGRGGEGNLQ